MQVPTDLSSLPAWLFPLVTFCLGVFFLTYVVRRVVEGYIPSFAARTQWQKVWLPSLPTIFGAVAAAIMHSYPFLNGLPTWGTRAVYGAVAGGLCNFMYKVVKAVIQSKLGVKVSESDSPPAEEAKPAALPPVTVTSAVTAKVEEKKP